MNATFSRPKEKILKRKKQIDLYLSDDDIDKLHDKYEALFKQVKDNPYLTPAQIDKECDVLSRKYDFDVELLSKKRKKEYLEEQAKINADDKEQIPWRRCWLWRLLGQPLTNRAQDIIEEQAALEAEEKFSPLEKDLDDLANKLYAGTGKKLSRRKRQRLMKKYLKLRDKLIKDNVRSDDAARDAEPQSLETSSEDPPAANNVQIQYVDYSLAGVSFVPRTANNTDVQSGAEPPELPARKQSKSQQQEGTTP